MLLLQRRAADVRDALDEMLRRAIGECRWVLTLWPRVPASFRPRTCGADPLVAVAICNGHGLVIVATCGLPVEALFASARSDRSLRG